METKVKSALDKHKNESAAEFSSSKFVFALFTGVVNVSDSNGYFLSTRFSQ